MPEILSFGLGATLAGTGRFTGLQELPAVPLVMDLIGGCPAFRSLRGITNYLAYGIGVALPYTDLIYATLSK